MYEIYRATSKNGKYTKVATLDEVREYEDTLNFNGNYYYKARAFATIHGKLQ